MKRALLCSIAVAAVWSSRADALPRFAARAGAECTLCHVSPSGGGVRNRYGSNVFQRTRLAIRWDEDDEDGDEGSIASFSPALTEWLTIGADLRLSYLFQKPETSPIEGRDPEVISSFFLMQADLYTSANFGPHIAAVFDVGIYSGFEAWVLLRATAEPSPLNLYLKVGHFLPSFGIREVNHDLFTRGGIGLGATDRDSGLEATAFVGPFSLSLSLVNGTFDDGIFDTRGSEHRSFEKAIVSRAAVRVSLLDALHLQAGGSIYANDNVDTANPLFTGFLPMNGDALAMQGVDELRAGAFLLAGLGRFVYSGELVYVRDSFVVPGSPSLKGYASYQELDVLLFQGMEVGATLEFMDPDVDVSENSTVRFGVMTEIFLQTFFDVRLMFRATNSQVPSVGDSTEFIAFAHSFF